MLTTQHERGHESPPVRRGHTAVRHGAMPVAALVLALSVSLAPVTTAGAGGQPGGTTGAQEDLTTAASAGSVSVPIRLADDALQRAIVQLRADRYAKATVSERSARMHLAIRSGPSRTFGGTASAQRG